MLIGRHNKRCLVYSLPCGKYCVSYLADSDVTEHHKFAAQLKDFLRKVNDINFLFQESVFMWITAFVVLIRCSSRADVLRRPKPELLKKYGLTTFAFNAHVWKHDLYNELKRTTSQNTWPQLRLPQEWCLGPLGGAVTVGVRNAKVSGHDCDVSGLTEGLQQTSLELLFFSKHCPGWCEVLPW